MTENKDRELDLGHDHFLRFMAWKPDRTVNPQLDHLTDVERIGGIIRHVKPDGTSCKGVIWFDCQVTREVFSRYPVWKVSSWEPLTLSPSFLCHCGDHGYIRDGKWVVA